MSYESDKIDEEILRDLEDAERKVENRREMRSGQMKKTLWGDMKFILVVDLPADLPEENFKKYMAEYGHILSDAFERA